MRRDAHPWDAEHIGLEWARAWVLSGRTRMPDHRFIATFHGLWRSYVAGEEVLHSMEWSRKVRKGLPPKGTGWEGLCEAWGIYHPRLSHISGHANDSSPPFSAGAS